MIKDDALCALFEKTRSIATLGANAMPGQSVDRVGRYPIAAGFTILPAPPQGQSVWGLNACPTLADISESADIVDLFRAPAYCPSHAREAAAMPPGFRAFWTQQGISGPEAAAILKNTGIMVVEDPCIMVAHRHVYH